MYEKNKAFPEEDFAKWPKGPEKKFLLLFDGTGRADARTSSAGDACIRIDLVDIALGNCTNRALACACSASYTAVSNLVSHLLVSFS